MATFQPFSANPRTMARPMPRPPPVTRATFSVCMGQHLAGSLEEKVIAPHHALVYAQALALVVDGMLEETLPAWSSDCQKLRGAEGIQDLQGTTAKTVRAGG